MDEQACLGLRERKKIKARLAIERAALELVLERGYDGTTVEDICERAEVSKKTFFNYFPSKAAVVTGRVSDFPDAEQLVAMMEAHNEMCYLDVLVNMISADYTVREGDDGGAEVQDAAQDAAAVLQGAARPAQRAEGGHRGSGRLS